MRGFDTCWTRRAAEVVQLHVGEPVAPARLVAQPLLDALDDDGLVQALGRTAGVLRP